MKPISYIAAAFLLLAASTAMAQSTSEEEPIADAPTDSDSESFDDSCEKQDNQHSLLFFLIILVGYGSTGYGVFKGGIQN